MAMQTIWFITGSSNGLGKALVELLSGIPDNFVYGLSRSELPNTPSYTHIEIDLSQQDEVLKFRFPEISTNKRVVLINNAATLGEIVHNGNLEEKDIIQTYFLNTISPHLLSNKFLHAYRDLVADQIIINITSGAANNPYDGWSLYCSSKAALQMQAQVMHAEAILQHSQVRSYAFAPGVLNTGMQAEIRRSETENFSKKRKFLDLFEDGALIDPKLAASDLIKLVENPDLYKECIYKYPL
jgi:benzil reductase ((S)-benzoin forming)